MKPTVTYEGEWSSLGSLYNILLPDGQQTSICLKPGQDLDSAVAQVIKKFKGEKLSGSNSQNRAIGLNTSSLRPGNAVNG